MLLVVLLLALSQSPAPKTAPKPQVLPHEKLSTGATVQCFRNAAGQVIWRVTDETGVHDLPWHETALGTNYKIPKDTLEGTILFSPRKVDDIRTFDKNGRPTSTLWSGLHGQSLRYPLNEYGGIMWWAPIGRPDLHVTPPAAALSMAAAAKSTYHYNPPVPVAEFFKQHPAKGPVVRFEPGR